MAEQTEPGTTENPGTGSVLGAPWAVEETLALFIIIGVAVMLAGAFVASSLLGDALQGETPSNVSYGVLTYLSYWITIGTVAILYVLSFALTRPVGRAEADIDAGGYVGEAFGHLLRVRWMTAVTVVLYVLAGLTALGGLAGQLIHWTQQTGVGPGSQLVLLGTVTIGSVILLAGGLIVTLAVRRRVNEAMAGFDELDELADIGDEADELDGADVPDEPSPADPDEPAEPTDHEDHDDGAEQDEDPDTAEVSGDGPA